ncbi:MAG: putative Ni/Fe-hydrogenase 2 b-type cytochrome subunit [Calditrichaeota bacterium]|nr:putative Ni/Fe-hydrogenase 2 b-type cytochrome subunit [Calditrichota bacterium]
MTRLKVFKTVLWAVTGLAFAVGLTRFVFGLGATTNLSDAVPWGFWIGFDVMGGVALAAGGFVLTAFVYIFRHREFYPIVRPAVLTAFLGYAAVVVGLIFDLGLPWNMWHLVIFWNPHSPLFEVGWCVMLYLSVLALEFLPIPLEEQTRWKKIHGFLMKLRIPLVIAGIALSTLHQSSLGTLFTIMPFRVHPLWYSPILPILFFLSAVGLGFMMVTFEGQTTAWLYRINPETKMYGRLNQVTPWVLLSYVVVRVVDLAVRGVLVEFGREPLPTVMFSLEMLLMGVVPVIFFAFRRIRRSTHGLWAVSFAGVFGIVLNRINTGGVMHMGRGFGEYSPAWTEIAISLGIVAAVGLVFFFLIENFHVLEERPREANAAELPKAPLGAFGAVWQQALRFGGPRVYSLAFVLAAAVGFGLLSGERMYSGGVQPEPARKSRGADWLVIDGNKDGYAVDFTHAIHMERYDCARCHHMQLPGDAQTVCVECHSDQYSPTDAFRHQWHASPDGAAISCSSCHPIGEVKSANSAASCDRCHDDLVPRGSAIPVDDHLAPSYVDAMHRLCIDCHKAEAKELDYPELPRCAHCHGEMIRYVNEKNVVRTHEHPSRSVYTPPMDVTH